MKKYLDKFLIICGLLGLSGAGHAQVVAAGQLDALTVHGSGLVAQLAAWSTIDLTSLTQSLGCFPTNSQSPQNANESDSRNYSYVEVYAGSLAAGEKFSIDIVICAGDSADMRLNPVIIFAGSNLQGRIISPDGSSQALTLGTRIYTSHQKLPMLSADLIGLQEGTYRIEVINSGRKTATLKEVHAIVRLRKPGTF